MFTAYVISLGLFVFLTPGCGLLFARLLRGYNAQERLTLVIFAGLTMLYLFGTVAYLYQAPLPTWRWGPALLALAGWLTGWRETRDWWQTPDTRATLKTWGLVIAGGLLALAFIRNYSGGEWAADWVEHYQRTLFFLLNWPPDFPFLGMYNLTARPPLINVVTATFMGSAGHMDFFYFQTFTALLGSCTVPALALLMTKWRARTEHLALLPLLLLANPMFVQNTTFTWTKLSAAAFTLAGVGMAWRAAPADTGRWLAAALLTAAGVLTHYSAAPYAIVLAVAYSWIQYPLRSSGATWRQAVRLVIATGGFALTWFGWALLRYGSEKVFGANTTVQYAQVLGLDAQLPILGENLLRTLIPHPFLSNDYGPLAQSNTLTKWRDYLFCIYQVCLPLTLGTGGLIGFCGLFFRRLRFHLPIVLGCVVLILVGVAANMAPMRWGVAHITLIPLAMGALAAVAARWDAFSPVMRRIIGSGLLVDFMLGVVLQLYGEHLVPPLKTEDVFAYASVHGNTFTINALSKNNLELVFAGDLAPPTGWLLATGAALLVLIVWNLRLENRRRIDLSHTPAHRPSSS